MNQIRKQGGFVIYVGVHKHNDVARHNANRLYLSVLKETMKRLNQTCLEDHHPAEDFLLVMDEHDSRADLVTEAARAMYNAIDPRTALIEPPFQAESYRYQTLQAADWLAGLIGRLTAYEAEPADYPREPSSRAVLRPAAPDGRATIRRAGENTVAVPVVTEM